MTNKFKD